MILGIGTDIAKVQRFEKWVSNHDIIKRFYHPIEIKENGTFKHLCEHYAVRFAAKEAFSKALGIGITGFELKDVYIENNNNGKPFLKVQKSAEKKLIDLFGECKIHVSLSHEKEYAIAFVIIESINQ